jgi:hypothetical protein
MDENKELAITLYDAKGAFLSGLLGFGVGALVALPLPLLLGRQRNVFVLAAMLFFAIPMIYFPFIKKKYLKSGLFLLDPAQFSIKEPSAEKNIVVFLKEIQSYQVSPFKNMVGIGFVLKMRYKSGAYLKLGIIDNSSLNFNKGISEDSVLYRFCTYINAYNSSQSDDQAKITAIPSFFASRSGGYLLWLPAGLLVADLLLRFSIKHPDGKYLGLFFVLIVFTVSLIGARSKDKQVFRRISELQEYKE